MIYTINSLIQCIYVWWFFIRPESHHIVALLLSHCTTLAYWLTDALETLRLLLMFVAAEVENNAKKLLFDSWQFGVHREEWKTQKVGKVKTGAILAIFQFSWFSGLFWPFSHYKIGYFCKTHFRKRRTVRSRFQKLSWHWGCDVIYNLLALFYFSNFWVFHSALGTITWQQYLHSSSTNWNCWQLGVNLLIAGRSCIGSFFGKSTHFLGPLCLSQSLTTRITCGMGEWGNGARAEGCMGRLIWAQLSEFLVVSDVFNQ